MTRGCAKGYPDANLSDAAARVELHGRVLTDRGNQQRAHTEECQQSGDQMNWHQDAAELRVKAAYRDDGHARIHATNLALDLGGDRVERSRMANMKRGLAEDFRNLARPHQHDARGRRTPVATEERVRRNTHDLRGLLRTFEQERPTEWRLSWPQRHGKTLCQDRRDCAALRPRDVGPSDRPQAIRSKVIRTDDVDFAADCLLQTLSSYAIRRPELTRRCTRVRHSINARDCREALSELLYQRGIRLAVFRGSNGPDAGEQQAVGVVSEIDVGQQ